MRQNVYFNYVFFLRDLKIKSMDNSVLTLTLEKEDYSFINVDEGVYVHSKLGTISKQDTGKCCYYFIILNIYNTNVKLQVPVQASI